MKRLAILGVLAVAAVMLASIAAPVFDFHHVANASDFDFVTALGMAGAGIMLPRKRLRMPLASAAMLGVSHPAIIGSVRADSGIDPAKLEALLKDVKQELTRVGDEVKKTAESALNQTKEQGKVTDEVKKKADDLMLAQSKLGDALGKIENKLETLETRNQDLEQKLAARRPGAEEKPKSFGEQVAESETFKAFAAAGARGTLRMPVKQVITSANTSGGDLIWSQRDAEVVGMPRRRMTIRQLLNPGRTTSNLIEYAKQTTRTNLADVVSETVAKPESNYVWDRADAPVRTVAHWVHVSRQAMDDIAQLQGEIDGELRYGLMLAEETQILRGDGTGQNLEGLVTAATAFNPAFSVTGETMIDTLRLALLQASLAEFPADGIVLHPTDWARVELTKDGEFRYIFANVIQLAGPQLWGRPVIDTSAMDEDEFLVGAFRAAATIYDRMDAEVLISSEDRDNFIKNMLTVRAEERLALAIKRPAALITGDFGNVSG